MRIMFLILYKVFYILKSTILNLFTEIIILYYNKVYLQGKNFDLTSNLLKNMFYPIIIIMK